MRERILHLGRRDFTWQTFRAGGKGGQNQNKRDTGVRCIHPPSGARGESRRYRTQRDNKSEAFAKMAGSPEFLRWARAQAGGLDKAVEDCMRPENLLIEYGPFEDY